MLPRSTNDAGNELYSRKLLKYSGVSAAGLRGLGAAIVATSILPIGACNSMGSKQLPLDRFDYNSAIASSSNEQMLLNLVRLSYDEVPVFLAVNSVLTQYAWAGDIGVAGAAGENLSFPVSSVGGSAGIRYLERPTITYIPLSGQEFTAQLIAPVRSDVIFALVSSGWPPDQLLAMTLQRVNDVENFGFDSPPSPGEDPARFTRVMKLIIELAKRSAIEIVRETGQGKNDEYLEFSQSPDAATAALINELKDATSLDRGISRFRVTRKIVARAPDEVTIRMHSLVALMGLLSAGVEAPAKPDSAGPEFPQVVPQPKPEEVIVPVRVLCQRERPSHAFVSVQYEGNWYFLDSSDHQSKRAFGLLTYLFQMQAAQNQGGTPVVTVSAG